MEKIVSRPKRAALHGVIYYKGKNGSVESKMPL